MSGPTFTDPTIAPGCTCSGMPEPDWDPECPEHRLTDSPGPASSPDAVTVWCTECGGPSDVAEDWTTETAPDGTEWRVRRLACTHEVVMTP